MLAAAANHLLIWFLDELWRKNLNQPFVVRFEKEEEKLSDETVLTYQKGNSTCVSFASLNSIFITNSGSIQQ